MLNPSCKLQLYAWHLTLPVVKQVQMSDMQQAASEAHHQLQKQQECYTDLQAQRASEQNNAAAAAQQHQQQLKEGHQLVQQLQEKLNASRQQEATLQHSCIEYVKQVETLTRELSAAVASAHTAQVCSAALRNSCPWFRTVGHASRPCTAHMYCLQRSLLFRLSCCE